MNITHNSTTSHTATSEKRKTTDHLSTHNPRDWFSILVWIFFNPARISIHHNVYGHRAMKRPAGWLIATLVTVTLGLLISPLLLDSYLARRFVEQYHLFPSALLIGTVLIGLAIGVLSYIENELSLGIVYGIGFGLAFGMTGMVAFGVMHDVGSGLGLIVGTSVVLGVIFGLAEVVVLRMAYVVAGIFAVGMTFGVAGIFIFAIAIFVSVTAGNILRRNVNMRRPTSAGFAVLMVWLTSVLMMVSGILTLIN